MSAADEFDDEKFCPKCYAGMLSAEHHIKCIVPARKAEERRLLLSSTSQRPRTGDIP